MELKNKVVFLLTYIEQNEWISFNPPEIFKEKYKDYSFIVLDNGNQPKMKQWCEDTGSYYYASEYNIGSSGGYNWIFRVASLLKLDRAILLQADVEIIDIEVLDCLLENNLEENYIPFWPQQPRRQWDTYDVGQVYNLGQIFSFCPDYLLEHRLLNDENYVVTHFDDADLVRRMRDSGMKLYNKLLDYPEIDCVQPVDKPEHVAEGLYKIHHVSSTMSVNHRYWEEYNQSYHTFKWFRDSDYAWNSPFSDDGDLNKMLVFSHRWTKLGYPPYPVEYEVNRFYKQWTSQ